MDNKRNTGIIFDADMVNSVIADLNEHTTSLNTLKTNFDKAIALLHFYKSPHLSDLEDIIKKITRNNEVMINNLSTCIKIYNREVKETYNGLNQTLYRNYTYNNSNIADSGCGLASIGDALSATFRRYFNSDDEYFQTLYMASGGKLSETTSGSGAKKTITIDIINNLSKSVNAQISFKYPVNKGGECGFGDPTNATKDVLNDLKSGKNTSGILYFKSKDTVASNDKIDIIIKTIEGSGMDVDVKVTRVWCASKFSGFSREAGHYVAGEGTSQVTFYDSVPKTAQDYADIYSARRFKNGESRTNRSITADEVRSKYLNANGHVSVSESVLAKDKDGFFDFSGPEGFVQITLKSNRDNETNLRNESEISDLWLLSNKN